MRHLCQTLLGRYPSNDLRRAAKVAMLQCSIRRRRGSKKTAVLALPSSLPSLPPLPLPSFDRDVHQITFSFSRNSIQSDTTATGPPPSPPSRAILSRPYRRCSKKTKRMEGREGRGETFVGGSSIQYSEINFARALALRLDRH